MRAPGAELKGLALDVVKEYLSIQSFNISNMTCFYTVENDPINPVQGHKAAAAGCLDEKFTGPLFTRDRTSFCFSYELASGQPICKVQNLKP